MYSVVLNEFEDGVCSERGRAQVWLSSLKGTTS